jgi:hypothetical protein
MKTGEASPSNGGQHSSLNPVAQEGELAAAVRAGEGFERGKLRQRFAELAEHRADPQSGQGRDPTPGNHHDLPRKEILR